MRTWLIAGIAAALGMTGPLTAGDKEDPQQTIEALNVNARYTIESVHLLGAKTVRLSQPLRGELDQVVGQKLDHPRLDKIAEQIKKELRVSDVTVKVEKGATPEHVKVDFEIKNSHKQNFDLNVARFLYNSKLGWTGEGRATTHVGGNAFSFGLVDDGDTLVERFAGIRAGYEREHVGTDRLRLRFDFASYHEQWKAATLTAADPVANPEDIYRTRQSFSPVATLVLAEPLELSFGTDFARFRLPAGYAGPSAKTESSNAVVSTLRYHRRWDSASSGSGSASGNNASGNGASGNSASGNSSDEQDLRASYSVRAGTHILESDSAFARHLAEARYKYHRAHSTIEIGFLAGRISGNAPLFERFTAGNSVLLRGWNKFDLDPLGASHIVHGSLDYSWRGFLVFYDTGAVWDRKPEREQKQSLGAGFRAKDGFQLAMAFPVRAGRAIPVFYAGLNF